MAVLFSIIGMALILGFIALLVLLVYFVVYQRNINQAMNNQPHRKMPSLYKVSIGLLIAVMTILLAVTLIKAFLVQNSTEIGEHYFNGRYDFDVYQPQEMKGYLADYQIDENHGYQKEIKEKQDIRYTIFTSEDPYDAYHPAYLIFVEYIGNQKIASYGYMGSYFTMNDQKIAGKGAAGSENEAYFVVIGNTDMNCKFELQVAYYQDDFKGDDLFEGYLVHDSIMITIGNEE